MDNEFRNSASKLLLVYAAFAAAVGYIGFDVKSGLDAARDQQTIVAVNAKQDEKIDALRADVIRLQTTAGLQFERRDAESSKARGLGCLCVKDIGSNQREVMFCNASQTSTSCSAQNRTACEAKWPGYQCQ